MFPEVSSFALVMADVFANIAQRSDDFPDIRARGIPRTGGKSFRQLIEFPETLPMGIGKLVILVATFNRVGQVVHVLSFPMRHGRFLEHRERRVNGLMLRPLRLRVNCTKDI